MVYALPDLDGHSVNNAFQRVESGRIHRTADPNCESSQSVRPEEIIYNRKASIERVADAQAEFCRIQCLLESFNASRNQKRSRNDVFRNSMEGNTTVYLHDTSIVLGSQASVIRTSATGLDWSTGTCRSHCKLGWKISRPMNIAAGYKT